MITTHVLDTSRGGPAVGVAVVLSVQRGHEWVRVSDGLTDEKGRLASLTAGTTVEPGLYRLTFDTVAYHRDPLTFFPEVQITFRIRVAGEHVHVPLLVSPFGYTSYRGM
jgi:5-hydroxyisourate hydrolase